MVSAADTVKIVEPPEPQFLKSTPSAAQSKNIQRRRAVGPENAERRSTSRTAKILVLLAILAAVAVGVWTYERFGTVKLPAPAPAAAALDLLQRRVMVSTDLMQSLITYRTMPVYPQTAERQGIQGIVQLDTVVGKDGRVLEVRPASGPPELAGAAMDAVKNWRFSPFTLDGDAVEIETTIGVEFRINDPGLGAPRSKPPASPATASR
jgi:protein TonB